jgi:hypothetical protein
LACSFTIFLNGIIGIQIIHDVPQRKNNPSSLVLTLYLPAMFLVNECRPLPACRVEQHADGFKPLLQAKKKKCAAIQYY